MSIVNLGEWIRNQILNFMAGPENSMLKWGNEPAWAEPLVGFSSGADPLYPFYKQDIGDFYILPHECMKDAYSKEYEPSQLTVISWILPQTEATKRDHRKETYFPSERWARSRIFGEQANVKLRKHVVTILSEQGYDAVAPMISSLWKGAVSEKYGFASTWSERHAAYAAGLGTFGLSDALITTRGMAMRSGSVIVDAVIEPSPRIYENHYEYCLFLAEGTCGKCIERCPIGAITEKGHDKVLCQKYVNMTRKYVPRHYGFDGYGCGLCQTGVPCESGIPKK
ncbi:epoxyqueuosine reductase [Thermoproteota archaeon]